MAWTKTEEEYLIKNYGVIPNIDIAKHLGKSEQSVKQRRMKLGIAPKFPERRRPPKSTLCGNCDNARADRCRWVKYGNPDKGIAGWVVVPTVVGGDKNAIHSIRVEYCPKFRRARNAG